MSQECHNGGKDGTLTAGWMSQGSIKGLTATTLALRLTLF